ncbi:MAG: hypothetical protein L3V56_02765 [Candidatus Magnetoovum sp. WYHC-5]|nr:hypothetical protein [Candidatus Magnetoovum sp. WYHC-5]
MQELDKHFTFKIDTEEMRILKNERDSLVLQLKNWQNGLEQKIAEFSELSKQNEKQKTNVSLIQNEVKEIQSIVLTYRQKLKSMYARKGLDEVEKEIEYYKAQKEFFKIQKDRLDAIKEEVIVDPNETRSEVRDCDKELKEKVIAFNIYEKEKEQLQKDITYFEEAGSIFIRLEERKKILNDIKAKFDNKNNELTVIKSRVTQQKEKLSHLQDTIGELTNKYLEVEGKSKSIKALLSERDLIKSKVTGLINEDNGLKVQLQGIETELESKTTTLTELTQNRKNMDDAFMQVSEELIKVGNDLTAAVQAKQRYVLIRENYEEGIKSMKESLVESFALKDALEFITNGVKEFSNSITEF